MSRAALLFTVLLAGCATAADIKPGVVRGLDDEGRIKTTEGLAVALTGCSDAEIWQAVRTSVAEASVSDSTNFWRSRSLTVLDDDEAAGVLRAKDNGWLNAVSYVGVYLHRVRPDLRLVEVTAFWHGRTVVLSNPWEPALLRRIQGRLPSCSVPAAEALSDPTGFRTFPLPAGRPLTEPGATASPIVCRHRADNAGGTRKDLWLAEYRRCMAGH